MKVCPFDLNGCQLGIRHLHAGFVTALVKFGLDIQAGAGTCIGDQVDDHVVTDERLASPVLGNVTE